MGRLVEGMADLLGSTTGPQVRVVVDVAADLPPAGADPNQLEMALLNLGVNARDAMPDGGTLRISATRESVRQPRGDLTRGHYVRLRGRLFSVIVHGDVEGAENVRRGLTDWMRFMHMESAGTEAELDRYIGYWKPYATSHDELDRDTAIQEEVRNAARTLCEALRAQRAGRLHQSGQSLDEPRAK